MKSKWLLSNFTLLVLLLFNLQVSANDEDSTITYDLNPINIYGTAVFSSDLESFPSVLTINEAGIKDRMISQLPDLFFGSSSIYMQKTNSGGGSPIIRGMIGNRVLILIDGIRVNNSTFRYGPNQYLNTINPHIVDHVEITTGASSVLYGSDALGGMINIVTKSDLGEKNISSYSQFSSADNGIYQNLMFSKKYSNLSVLASGSYKKMKDLNSGGVDNIQKLSGFNNFDIFAKLRYSVDSVFTVTFNYQNNTSFDVPRTDRYMAGNDIKHLFNPQRRESFVLNYSFKISSPIISLYESNIVYNRQKEGREIISAKSPTVQTNDLDNVNTFGIFNKAKLNWGGNLNSEIGIDYYQDYINSIRYSNDLVTGVQKLLKPQFADKSKYRSFGIYLNNGYDYDNFSFLFGLRYNYYKINAKLVEPFEDIVLEKNSYSFNAGIMYRLIRNELNLVANFSQGFRNPSIEDLTVFGKSGSGSGARFDVPNTALKPEYNNTFDIGIKYFGNDFNTAFYAYYSRLEDFMNPVPGTYNGLTTIEGYPVYIRQNIESGYVYGFEWFFSSRIFEMINIQNQMNYTFGNSETLNEPLSRIPPLNGKLSLNKNFDKVDLEYYILWSTKQDRLSSTDKKDFRIGLNGTDCFTSHNLSFSYYLLDFAIIYCKLENIFDEYFKTHGSGIYAPGRNLILSIDFKI